ncbi:MAG: hypothetical protein ACRDGQ_08760, partial [Candidatus Limnocylindrales bacterium]
MPTLVSERQATGHWDRCLESSFAMLADKMSTGNFRIDPRKLESVIPNAGNGSNAAENIAAIATVYPSFPSDAIHTFKGADVIAGLLTTGRGLALNGYYDQLAPLGDFTRWDPAFAKSPKAAHATYSQIDGPEGERRWSDRAKAVWWMDPLATTGYPGEWMPFETLLAFIKGNPSTNAYGAEGVIGPGAGPEIPVQNFTISGPTGEFVVTGSGHYYLNLADGSMHVAIAGTKVHAVAGKLVTPIPGGAAGADRSSGYLWSGTSSLAVFLASDGTFTPDDD